MSNTQTKTKNLILCGLFTALMAICSWISIPTAVPFTLQTFAVFLSVLMLGPKYSAAAMVTYLLAGMAGIPVFAGFQAGAGIVFGPLGGYMLGFIPACIISGILVRKKRNRTLSILSLMAGITICYAVGTCWFVHVAFHEESILVVLATCVLPFIIPDILKAWLAVILSERLKAAGFR